MPKFSAKFTAKFMSRSSNAEVVNGFNVLLQITYRQQVNKMETAFLTSGKAAKFLDVSEKTLRRWEKTGMLLPHHKSISGYKYYTEQQLSDFSEGYHRNILEIQTDKTVADDEPKIESNRQSKANIAPYHYFSTSRLVRELEKTTLNELATIPMGKFGSVDIFMWVDEKMQEKLGLVPHDIPEHELRPTNYDIFIIESILSLKKANNKEFTTAQLVKHMHGNSLGGISDVEIQFVENRILTMMTWNIQIKFSEEFRRYPKMPEKVRSQRVIQGHLLDTTILERKDKGSKTRNLRGNPINGCFGIPADKDVAVILETYSESIKQLTCFPTSLLDIKGTRNSRAARILTNYLAKKIQGLKGNKRGINTIRFSTIEKELGISGDVPAKKARVFNAIIKAIQSCKEKGQIKDYEVIMDGKIFHSIKLAWEGAPKKRNVRNGVKRGNKVRSR